MRYKVYDWNKARRDGAYKGEEAGRKYVATLMHFSELANLEERARENESGKAFLSTLYDVDVTAVVE